MLRKLTFIILLALVISGTGSLFANYPFVYRNDGKFDRLDPHANLTLHHSVEDSVLFMEEEDFSIPLSAVDSISVRRIDIPSLFFTFPENPDLDWVVSKEDYIPAELEIKGCGMVEDMTDLSLTVKGRGNSTWAMPKKPMRMKFSKKTSICGFKKAKNYVLLNNYLDQTHLKNALGLWLARRIGMEYTNHTMPCNVYVNGEYSGLYLLTEKVGINGGSVDIDEEKGILFEIDNHFDENYKFYSATYNLPVMVKDPDFDELYENDPEGLTPEERLELWREDFERAEKSVQEMRGETVIDMQSAVDYYFIMNFVKNNEFGFPRSVYMYKKDLDPESLYYFGPVWDLDATYNEYQEEPPGKVNDPVGNVWAPALFAALKKLPQFQELYNRRLQQFKDEIYPELIEWCDDYADLIEPAARMDGLRWPLSQNLGWAWRVSSFDNRKHVDELMDWIQQRYEFMMQELKEEPILPEGPQTEEPEDPNDEEGSNEEEQLEPSEEVTTPLSTIESNNGGDEPENPGDDDPENPGGDEPENPGDDEPENPGDDEPENPGDDEPENPGGDEPENPGDDEPENPGDDEPENPGDDEPENPGGEIPGEIKYVTHLQVHSHDSVLHSIKVDNDLRLNFYDGQLTVVSTENEVTYMLEDVKRLVYVPVEEKEVPTDVKDSYKLPEIMISKDGFTVTPSFPGILRIYDMTGCEVFTHSVSVSFKVENGDMPKGINIVTFNGKTILKVLNI